MSSVLSRVGIGSIKSATVSRRQPQRSQEETDFLIQSSKMNARLSSQKSFFDSSKTKRAKTALSNSKPSYGAKSVFTDRSFYIPSDEERRENPQLSLELLRTMTPKNCIKYLDANPVFLKAMCDSGFIDNEIMSSVSISLTAAELQKFLMNLTTETNLFSSMNLCQKVSEFESKISTVLPIHRTIYWLAYENCDFVFSEKLKVVLKTSDTIIRNVFDDGNDHVYPSCTNADGFSAENDGPIVDGFKTMLLLPVRSDDGSIIGVLQFIGFKRSMSESEMEFPTYHVECLKIIRDIFQKKFTQQVQRGIPNNVTQMFKGIDKSSVKYTTQQLVLFFTSTFNCQNADIYEFNEKNKELTRLSDRTVYTGIEDGGVSYHTAVSRVPTIIPHGFQESFDYFHNEVDNVTESKAILAMPMFYMQRTFVVTLRGKNESPSFTTEDVMLLQNISPIITDTIRVSAWLEAQTGATNESESFSNLVKVACDALSETSEHGKNKWEILKESAKKMFGTEYFYVGSFDGRNITLSPNGGTAKFEECAAGLAYNYRDALRTKRGEKNFKPDMYKGSDIEVNETLAFPYRANGRIAGAIEIINPKEDIPEGAINVFSDLCGLLYSP